MSKALHTSITRGLIVGIDLLGLFMTSAARAGAAHDQLEAGLNQVSELMESKTYERHSPKGTAMTNGPSRTESRRRRSR